MTYAIQKYAVGPGDPHKHSAGALAGWDVWKTGWHSGKWGQEKTSICEICHKRDGKVAQTAKKKPGKLFFKIKKKLKK